MTLPWNVPASEDDERSAEGVELGGELGCGFVNPEFAKDVPAEQGDFCTIQLDKPICLLPHMSMFEDETKKTWQVQPEGDPHDLDKAYGGKHVVVKGTVYSPRTGHHHASLAMHADSIVAR